MWSIENLHLPSQKYFKRLIKEKPVFNLVCLCVQTPNQTAEPKILPRVLDEYISLEKLSKVNLIMNIKLAFLYCR